MKFTTILFNTLLLLLCLFYCTALEKTQKEVHQFLMANNYVTNSSRVHTFGVDFKGYVRIELKDSETIWYYGLEQINNTYNITYSNKKQQPHQPLIVQRSSTMRDQMIQRIGQTIPMLKGGRIISMNHPYYSNKDQFQIQYILKSKIYTIYGTYQVRTRALSITKVEDQDSKPKPQEQEDQF